MLKSRFGLANIATIPQATATKGLFVRAFYTGARGILGVYAQTGGIDPTAMFTVTPMPSFVEL
jgi:hypothetical protein